LRSSYVQGKYEVRANGRRHRQGGRRHRERDRTNEARPLRLEPQRRRRPAAMAFQWEGGRVQARGWMQEARARGQEPGLLDTANNT